MKKQILTKKLILKLHEILGLGTGLVVFVVALTGCCWVFKDEIQSLYIEEWTTSIRPSPVLTPSKARDLAQSVFPARPIHGTLYGQPDKAIEVIFYQADPLFYQSVFLHPYSGDVLHTEDHNAGFFAFVLDGHIRLWLPDEIGSQIVALSVFVFLFILLTGLVLWWPKKNNCRQRLTFAWRKNTRWKRKNFDLHSIAGFYVLALAFTLACTGSIMAYDWFYYGVYKATGGERVPQFIVPNNLYATDAPRDSTDLPIDRLLSRLQRQNPAAASFEVHYPPTDSTSIYVEITYQEGVYYSSDYRFFDQSTLDEIDTPSIYGKYEDAAFADKLIRMNYDIHVGAIGGLAGKLIVFLTSLITATLPITGFLLWYGKRYKWE